MFSFCFDDICDGCMNRRRHQVVQSTPEAAAAAATSCSSRATTVIELTSTAFARKGWLFTTRATLYASEANGGERQIRGRIWKIFHER